MNGLAPRTTNLLGKFKLSGIAPAPCAVPQIEVTFDIDAHRILKVSPGTLWSRNLTTSVTP